MTINVTTETGTTATFGAINNQYGSITVTAVGDGTHNIGASGSASLTAVTQTIDFSGATGTGVVDTVSVTGTAVTLAVGSGPILSLSEVTAGLRSLISKLVMVRIS